MNKKYVLPTVCVCLCVVTSQTVFMCDAKSFSCRRQEYCLSLLNDRAAVQQLCETVHGLYGEEKESVCVCVRERYYTIPVIHAEPMTPNVPVLY